MSMELMGSQTYQKGDQFNNNSEISLSSSKNPCHSPCGQYYREVINRMKEYWSFTCAICVRTFERSQIESFAQCEHSLHFCKSCISIYIRLKIMTYEEIYCPHENCKAPLDITSTFFQKLPSQTQKRYKKIRASIQKLHDANFRTCPDDVCEGNIIFKGNSFECTMCSKKFCLNCLAAEHKGECYFAELQYYQKQFNMRRCPNCKFLIQKSQGCNFMKCRCKFQFCYQCNGAYNVGHRCQYDRSGRVIMNKPVFKEEKVVDEVQKIEISKQVGIQENILLTLFMFTFIIPLLIILFVIFSVGMAGRMVVLFLEIVAIVMMITILGLGPFTLEFAGNFGRRTKFWLMVIYPVIMLIGCYRAFRQLASFTISPLIERFIRKGRSLFNYLFVELFQ